MPATPVRSNPADQGGYGYWGQPQQSNVGTSAPQTSNGANVGPGASPWNHAPGWGPGGSGGETPFGQPGSPYSGAGFAGMYDYSDPFSKTWGGFRY